MYDDELDYRPKSILGHYASGGGATIANSPIHIHIHIHSENVTFVQRMSRIIKDAVGIRALTIENAAGLPDEIIQRRIRSRIEN